MSNWIEKTLAKLLPGHTPHILVSDPDSLLNYHEVSKVIETRGYKVLRATSRLDVRIIYELTIRGSDEKVVLVTNTIFKPLPDILIDAYLVTIGYKDIFPYLDSKALSGLSFNALCSLDELRPYDSLGYDATIRFLLENLYHTDLEALKKYKTKERVLATLIEVFFHKDTINAPIVNYLKSIAKPLFSTETEALLSKDGLKQFIQDLWNNHGTDTDSSINFSDPLLAKTLGNLLVRRILTPVKTNKETLENIPLSLRMGFYVDETAENRARINVLTDYIHSRSVSIQDQFIEWLELGKAVGEVYYLALSLNDPLVKQQVRESLSSLNNRFQRFVQNTYWSLFSLSGSRYPAVITRVLDYMHAQSSPKKVLIVIDGMNLWQWHLINMALEENGLSVNQLSTIAYLPSITAWSRQALLKGGKPDLDKDNSSEEKLFREYWTGKGYQQFQIVYQRFDVEKPVKMDLMPSASVVALVCNDLDDLMHGAVMGDEQLLQDTQQWVHKIEFTSMIQKLRDMGYICFITSDHGSLEASAVCNLPMSAKNLSTSKSKRHIRFVSNEQAKQFQDDNHGLAVKRRESSLYLTDETAFIKDGKTITHGGSHLLEMIIPLGVIE